MAITSEIIGKLGGADVESAEVAGREITAPNMAIHTVAVPPGKQVLVSFIGRFSKVTSSASSWPALKVGGSEVKCEKTGVDACVSAILTQTGSVTISGGAGLNSSTLSGGTVYIAEM